MLAHFYAQESLTAKCAQWLCLSGLGYLRNGGEAAKIVVFAAIGDGFQVFRIAPVGDADTNDLALLCHVDCLLFLYNGMIGKLIPGDPAAFFHQSDDPLCVRICLGNLIQGLLCEFLPVHAYHSFVIVSAGGVQLHNQMG